LVLGEQTGLFRCDEGGRDCTEAVCNEILLNAFFCGFLPPDPLWYSGWLLENTTSDIFTAVHIILKCSETRKLREHLLSRRWQILNEELAYRKIINCTNTVEGAG
jgi:hypothetical protein